MTEQHAERASVGTWVRVTGFVPGQEDIFHLVPEEEADYLENKIPPGSPLASALEGARPGDRIAFHPPAGDVELKVLEIGPR
jgi:transcription elongation GreA/GreB family factor